MNKESLESICIKEAKKSARRVSIILATIFALSSVGLFVFSDIKRLEAIVHSNGPQLLYLLKMGDSFQLKRNMELLSSGGTGRVGISFISTSSGSGGHSFLFDSVGGLKTGIFCSSETTIQSLVHRLGCFSPWKYLFVVNRSIGLIDGRTYILSLLSSIEYIEVVFISIFSWIISYFSLRQILLRNMRRLTLKIGRPIEKLSGVVKTNPSRIEEALSTLKIREIYDLASSFDVAQKERKKFEEKYVESKKFETIAMTTQMLAHDVRRPFSLIKKVLQILGKADVKDVKRVTSDLLPDVDKSLKKVNEMLNEVTDLGTPPKKRTIHLDEILGEFVKGDIGELLYEKLDFSFNHSSVLNVDPVRLTRVISNIVCNAFEAMDENGRVSISTEEKQGFLNITIHNEGSVISDIDQKNLFDPYFTKGKVKGTGLGLAIVKKFVEEHSGKISCQSSVANGTTFLIKLPTTFVTI